MNTRTLAFGQLESNGDTWFLVKADRFVPLDAAIADNALDHKVVSVVGTMGIPPSSPGILKLIVDRIASHEAIARRAHDIFESERAGSSDENWLRAERELLGM